MENAKTETNQNSNYNTKDKKALNFIACFRAGLLVLVTALLILDVKRKR